MSLVTVSESMEKIYPGFTDSIPHVTTYVDSSALNASSSDSPKNVFILGSAENGNPDNVYECTSLLQAKQIFGSGDLVNAMELIWKGAKSSEYTGGTVFAARVEDATQSSLTKGALTFTSLSYGSVANNIQVAMGKDSTTSSVWVEVKNSVDDYDTTYTNIGNLFTLAYSGTASAAAYTVTTDDNGNAATFKLQTGTSLESLTDFATFDLTSNDYANMAQLVQAINNLTGFTATTLGYANSILTSYLDEASAVSITGDGATVTAYIGGILYAINESDSYVNVSISSVGTPTEVIVDPTDSGATITANLSAGLPDAFDLTSLTGGTTGSVPLSWSDKIKKIEDTYGKDVQTPYYIVLLTDSASVHAELKEYLTEQAEYGYNYFGFVGGSYDETVSKSISRQIQLQSSRIGLVATSGYHTLTSGTSLHMPGYMMAAAVAGIASSIDVGNAVTNKYLDLDSIDQTYSPDDLNRLDSNGCIAIKHVINRTNTGGYAIVEDVTTYNSSNETAKKLVSVVELIDYLEDDLRYYLDKNYIGVNVTSNSVDLVKSNIESFLDDRVSEGMIVSYTASDITVTISGQSVYITFTVDPSLEVRNILAYTTLDSYSSSSTSSSSD